MLLLLLLLLLLLYELCMLWRIHAVIPRMMARRRGSRWPWVGGVASGRWRRIAVEGHSLWSRRWRVVSIARMMIGVRRMVRIRRGLMMLVGMIAALAGMPRLMVGTRPRCLLRG